MLIDVATNRPRGPPPVPLHYNGVEDRKTLAACVLHLHQLLSFTATATVGSRVECALQYIACKYLGVEGIQITTVNQIQGETFQRIRAERSCSTSDARGSRSSAFP